MMLCCLLLTGQAQSQLLFPDELNQLSDNAAAYLINAPGSAPGDTTLDVGDRLRGMLNVETIEGLVNGGKTVLLALPEELTAIYDVTVLDKVQTGVGSDGLPRFRYTFGPSDAGAWTGLSPAPVPGTMLRFYFAPTSNFTRLGGPDDGDPSNIGADIGFGPFAAEEAVRATASDGAAFWDLGFTGPAGGNGLPLAVPGEGWVAVNALENIAAARLLTPPAAAAFLNLGLNQTRLDLAGPLLDDGVLTTPFGGTAAINGSGSVLGIAGAVTPMDFFGNVDFSVFPLSRAAVGDFVWEDTNGNGLQDAGEPGIPGVTVNLLDCAGNLVATTVTGLDGRYLFDNLIPGDYSVEFVLPGGQVFTLRDQGGDDGLDSDADGSTGRTVCFTLGSGQTDLSRDAGLVVLAELGDFVWEDTNGNGLQDAGEPGIPGVTVNLLDGTGAFKGTITTDANGRYLFDDLQPGDYIVEFVAPVGRAFTLQDQGGDDTVDSDAAANGRTVVIGLESGESDLTWDAGILPLTTARIGDFVWEDTNGNGLQDAGEPGVEGVTVRLLDCQGNELDVTLTDANGLYLFDNLAAGDYTVEFMLPSGFEFTLADQGGNDAVDSDADGSTGRTVCFTLGAGEADLSRDAGLVIRARLGDFVWEDTNGNGLQDAGEPGIPGVTVNLLDGAGNPLASTTTDASGRYLFDDLQPGDYIVEFVAPAGRAFTLQDQGGDDTVDSDAAANGRTVVIGLESGESDLTWDAGILLPPPTARIGDFVWEDLNGNGLQDAGEPGVPGVTVNLQDCSGTVLATTTTDANGLYLFDGLSAGNYVVRFNLPADFEFTSLDQGGNDAVDSDADPTSGNTACFSLNAGEADLSRDAGLIRPAKLGDFVWEDTDGDGLQDAGEPGIPDVTVRLLDCAGQVIAATTTDANGRYLFDDLLPGDYIVEFVAPAGRVFTLQDQGGNDGLDSDADTTTGRTVCFTLQSGQTDLTRDAGLVTVECGECDGKVTTLTLRYDGAQAATIKVVQKKDGDVVFEAVVQPGEEFSFVGTDKGTLGTEISVFVDGVLNTKIHTSCSQPIGPGLVFGDFTVTAGRSKNGGELCPLPPPPPGECGECDGKVTTLTLRYDGAQAATIKVVQKKDGDVVFEAVVQPGEEFSFVGTDKGTLGTEISVFVDGVLNTKIHTSCSQPIGPGLVFGDFTITAGSSKNGGKLCPLPPQGHDDCKDDDDDKHCKGGKDDDDDDDKHGKGGKDDDDDDDDKHGKGGKDDDDDDDKHGKGGKDDDD